MSDSLDVRQVARRARFYVGSSRVPAEVSIIPLCKINMNVYLYTPIYLIHGYPESTKVTYEERRLTDDTGQVNYERLKNI